MNYKQLLLFLFLSLTAFSQQSELEYTNNRMPIFPGCELAENKYDCYVQKFGSMILDSLNSYHKAHPFPFEKIYIEIMIRTEADGTSVINKLRTEDETVKSITEAALENIPKVYPITTPEGDFAGSSLGFWVKLRKNETTGQYQPIIISQTEKWLGKSSPMPMKIVDAAFPEPDIPPSLRSRFIYNCADWFISKLSPEAITEAKGQTLMLKITIDESGNLYSHELFTTLATIKKESETILKDFPQVEPSTVDGNPYKATYMVPLNIK